MILVHHLKKPTLSVSNAGHTYITYLYYPLHAKGLILKAHCCQLAQNKTNASNEVNKNKVFRIYRNFHPHNFYMYNILQALNSAFYYRYLLSNTNSRWMVASDFGSSFKKHCLLAMLASR